ncbi:MAG: phosphate starvation-inducible protein PhoH [Rhodobiaceae bacterium]|nr:phosphate starvation-inducible protein PhoH [Rhodobiaceae bacterium]|tara:strand:- start:45 stop:452 length:408 start_codon:yes stop_codon:yes gene_type:complete
MPDIKPKTLVKFIEKFLLAAIAILTIIATIQEIYKIFLSGQVNLADLLLLFIYTEVLGMIGVFYSSNRIPITLPLFIAMTAISRLMILQGKDMEASTLLYEAGAILILSLACLAVRFRPSRQYEYQGEPVVEKED